jgi:DNA modification methylase
MKPVELVEHAVRNGSKTRDIVLDPFGGSGSTLFACEKAGRRARPIELDPKYVEVIVRRWEAWTGRQANRATNGALFGVETEAASRCTVREKVVTAE